MYILCSPENTERYKHRGRYKPLVQWTCFSVMCVCRERKRTTLYQSSIAMKNIKREIIHWKKNYTCERINWCLVSTMNNAPVCGITFVLKLKLQTTEYWFSSFSFALNCDFREYIQDIVVCSKNIAWPEYEWRLNGLFCYVVGVTSVIVNVMTAHDRPVKLTVMLIEAKKMAGELTERENILF